MDYEQNNLYSQKFIRKRNRTLVDIFEQSSSQFFVPNQEDIYVNINGITFSLDKCSEAAEKTKKLIEALKRIGTGELITTQRGAIFIDRDEKTTLQDFALGVLKECGL